MLNSYNLSNGLPIFKAFSSEIRVRLFQYITRNEGRNIRQIAQAMQMPVTSLTPHLQVLEQCGLVRTIETATAHGKQKCCFTISGMDSLEICLHMGNPECSTYIMELPVGSYSDFSVTPTCGLASTSSFIGQLDEPRYFAHPAHQEAGILWFTTGYVEYILPCFLPHRSRIIELSFSLELCSECPSVKMDWPSDISFFLNGTMLGSFRSPGDFGDRPGRYNPDWWYPFLGQYGLRKTLKIGSYGVWMDEEKLSGTTIEELALTDLSIMKFRIAVLKDSSFPGGCTLYGQGFGDHSSDIQALVKYQELS